MTIRAVEGAAGCGKTYRLIEYLTEALAETPLLDGQRVLGMTFMHGARKRLADRLRSVDGAKGCVECITIDSLAWRLLKRWRGLATSLGLPAVSESQFNAVCDTAGALLERQEVRQWVASSFPVIVVDEGQDLSPERLRMLRAISGAAKTLIAADEFQCLDQALRPNPLVGWLQASAEPETLTLARRTNVAGLLNAASAIRAGTPPVNSGQLFSIMPAPSIPFAAAALANAIAWHPGTSNLAVISPALAGGFAQGVVARVCNGPCGQHHNGPYSIVWEGTDREEVAQICEHLAVGEMATASETLDALHALPRSSPVRATISWVERQVHALGRMQFSRGEIEATISRYVTLRRHHGGSASIRFTALTVQQAKNREFDGVVVLWPYQVGGDAEHKRRLLYNAITRAKRWCNVIVQGANIPAGAPFA